MSAKKKTTKRKTTKKAKTRRKKKPVEHKRRVVTRKFIRDFNEGVRMLKEQTDRNFYDQIDTEAMDEVVNRHGRRGPNIDENCETCWAPLLATCPRHGIHEAALPCPACEERKLLSAEKEYHARTHAELVLSQRWIAREVIHQPHEDRP